MSKIGKKPIMLPSGVSCKVENSEFCAKGPKGELKLKLIYDDIDVIVNEDNVMVKPKNNSLRARKFWGTVRSSINNMVVGVSNGFTKSLEINGVGYRMSIKGKNVIMNLGLSHEVEFPIPEGINAVCPDATHINITGINKQEVGQIASKIKLMKKPEPYKGKGFKYVGEQILRKEGKKK